MDDPHQEALDYWGSRVNTQTVVIEQAVEDVAAVLGVQLDAVKRVDVTVALERMAEATAWHERNRSWRYY